MCDLLPHPYSLDGLLLRRMSPMFLTPDRRTVVGAAAAAAVSTSHRRRLPSHPSLPPLPFPLQSLLLLLRQDTVVHESGIPTQESIEAEKPFPGMAEDRDVMDRAFRERGCDTRIRVSSDHIVRIVDLPESGEIRRTLHHPGIPDEIQIQA